MRNACCAAHAGRMLRRAATLFAMARSAAAARGCLRWRGLAAAA